MSKEPCPDRSCINSSLNWNGTQFCKNCQPGRTRSGAAPSQARASSASRAARRQCAPYVRAVAGVPGTWASPGQPSTPWASPGQPSSWASPGQPSTPRASPLSRMPEVVQHALLSLTPVQRPSMALPPIVATPSPFVDELYVPSATPIGLVPQRPASPAPTPAAPPTALSGWASLACINAGSPACVDGSPACVDGSPPCVDGSPAGNLSNLFDAVGSTPFGH